MGFFDRLKNLNFGKIANTIGKVVQGVGQFQEAYSKGQGGFASKLISGISSVDLGNVMQIAGQVKQQIDVLRDTVKQIDVPQAALNQMKQQVFIAPVYTKPDEIQSTKEAINTISMAADLIEMETVNTVNNIEKLEQEIMNTERKLQDLIKIQDQIGQGFLVAQTAPLIDDLTKVNNELIEATNRIIQDANTHQGALNGIKNSIIAVTNTRALQGGTLDYQQRNPPLLGMVNLYERDQMSNMRLNGSNYRDWKDYTRLQGQQSRMMRYERPMWQSNYQNDNQFEDFRPLPKRKPIKKRRKQVFQDFDFNE